MGCARNMMCFSWYIFSLMWHEPGRGSQSKQRNGGRRTDPKRGLEVLQVHRGS